MTEQRTTRVPQFFLTPGGPCPYLPGRTERKVFARLNGMLAQPLNEALTHSGFRRSQSIAYRPACENCTACVSVRIVAEAFEYSRGQRRIVKRNADLVRCEVAAEATREQFALLRTYLDSRHAGGGSGLRYALRHALVAARQSVHRRADAHDHRARETQSQRAVCDVS